MNILLSAFNGFYQHEEGASATEYAVLILLIILVALVAIGVLGGEVNKGFELFSEQLNVYKS